MIAKNIYPTRLLELHVAMEYIISENKKTAFAVFLFSYKFNT